MNDWLPEDAREALDGEHTHPNYVAYLAPDGSTYSYIASDKEIAWYKKAFQWTLK
jgi:hypothetical protein